MMRSTMLLGLALFSLASVAGCAAEEDEALDSANGAYTFASGATSPLLDGLYSDGAGSYLRASSHGWISPQQVEWSFVGRPDRGTGSADVPRPGADNLTVKQVSANVTRTLSIVVSATKDKVVVDESATDGSPTVRRSFSPVAYQTLDTAYDAQTEPTATSKLDAEGVYTVSDYGVTIRKSTEAGLDLVVTGPSGASSSDHFTWDARALRLTSSSCGTMWLSLGGSPPALQIITASAERGCEVFSAIRVASPASAGRIELRKR